MAYLALVRHGESLWNAKGLWTGWTDIELSENGHLQAREAGKVLSDIHFDMAYTSNLIRAQQTLEEILDIIQQQDISITKNQALNERDYGDLTGKNKWKIKEEYGEEQFLKWRRGWDITLPNGESLKDVYARVIPYFKQEILPKLKDDKNILIAAHGNSLRALIKFLEDISDQNIPKLEVGLGEVYLFSFDQYGAVTGKEIRAANETRGKI